MIFFLIMMIAYMAPGLYVARGIYSERVREISNNPTPKVIAPPKPPRPAIRTNEMLHQAGVTNKCQILLEGYSTCTCKHRSEWIANKNAWIDYNDWVHRYGRINLENIGQPEEAQIPYMALPFWPIYLTQRFITAGAKNIPNYREIERLERTLAIESKEE